MRRDAFAHDNAQQKAAPKAQLPSGISPLSSKVRIASSAAFAVRLSPCGRGRNASQDAFRVRGLSPRANFFHWARGERPLTQAHLFLPAELPSPTASRACPTCAFNDAQPG